MSPALAMAGVSGALRTILARGLAEHRTGDVLGTVPTVLLMPPRPEHDANGPALSLFLYRVAENGALRNIARPPRGDDDRVWQNPPIALDLHYLITALGASDLQTEVLLGSTVLTLHATPVLRREVLGAALTDAFGTGAPAWQSDAPRIALTNLRHDEVTQLWSALQTPLRASVTCQVSAVMMDEAGGEPVHPGG